MKSSKIRQEWEALISTFVQFLIVFARIFFIEEGRCFDLCLHDILNFFNTVNLNLSSNLRARLQSFRILDIKLHFI